MTRLLTNALRQWSTLFLGQGCCVCDRPGSKPFCLDCERQLPEPSAFSESPNDDLLSPSQNQHQENVHSLPVHALGPYSNALKRAILAMKYSNRPEVARVLGHQLGQQWQTRESAEQFVEAKHLPGSNKQTPDSWALYAVPIPLHPQRQRARGYNQAELIARAFCQTSGLPLLAHGLTRRQATVPQHQLSLSDRQQNLKEAFAPTDSIQQTLSQQKKKKKTAVAIIVDDIYTTGTTARSAAETLEQAGMPVIAIAALARAMR